MIKLMKTINIKKGIFVIMTTIIIILLKRLFINSIYEGEYITYIKKMLFMQSSDNFMINFLWLLPIVLNIYVITTKGYDKLSHFDIRFINRKKYVKCELRKLLLETLYLNIFIVIIQMIAFSLQFKISLNISLLKFILHYLIYNIGLDLIIIFISLIIKKYMYSFIIILIMLIVFLQMNNKMFFLDLGNWNIVSMFIIISLFTVVLIYRLYLHLDIKEVNYEN